MARKSVCHRRSRPKLWPTPGEDAVDAVTNAAFEIVAVHALNVVDDRLDSRTTLHLAPP